MDLAYLNIISLQRIEREATFRYQTLTVPDVCAANVVFANGFMLHLSGDEYPASAKVRYYIIILKVMGVVLLALNGCHFSYIWCVVSKALLMVISVLSQVVQYGSSVPRKGLKGVAVQNLPCRKMYMSRSFIVLIGIFGT